MPLIDPALRVRPLMASPFTPKLVAVIAPGVPKALIFVDPMAGLFVSVVVAVMLLMPPPE